MQRLRETELDILKEVVRVCDLIGVRYYLMYGTLLGAVRHKGFIPWDDDIDIGMLRSDYEKFIANGQPLIDKRYFIQTHHSDPEYPMNFAKVRNFETTFIETSMKNFNINHGVYIDVFPIDYYPDIKPTKLHFEFTKRVCRQRIRKDFTLPEEVSKALTKPYSGVLMAVSSVLIPKRRAAVERLERLYRSVKESPLSISNSGAWSNSREILPYSWYGEGTPVEFEGMKLNAPAEYDKWLTKMYGDYMQLPPVEKRKAHHFNEAVDFDKPYTEYTNLSKKLS